MNSVQTRRRFSEISIENQFNSICFRKDYHICFKSECSNLRVKKLDENSDESSDM